MDASEIFSEKLLKATDVAEILNISRSMTYRILQTGQIRSISIGEARRVRPGDLADFINRNLSPVIDEEVSP